MGRFLVGFGGFLQTGAVLVAIFEAWNVRRRVRNFIDRPPDPVRIEFDDEVATSVRPSTHGTNNERIDQLEREVAAHTKAIDLKVWRDDDREVREEIAEASHLVQGQVRDVASLVLDLNNAAGARRLLAAAISAAVGTAAATVGSLIM